MNYFEIFTKHFSSTSLNVILVYLLSLSATFIIEMLAVGREKSTLYKLIKGDLPKTSRQDIVIWFLDISGAWLFLGKLITLGATFYFAVNFNPWLSNIFSNNFSAIRFLPLITLLPIQILIYFLISDFVGYWLHRTFHRAQLLWTLHKFHHSATEMSIFTARRDNPVVVPIFVLFTGLPVILFGYPSEFPLWVIFLGTLHASLIHSQIASNWGIIGRWLVVSPLGHLIHHSKAEPHHDKNFAFMFPIWDHIFGTFYNGDVRVQSIGIKEN